MVKVPLNPSGRLDCIALHGDGWSGRLTISDAVFLRDRLTAALDHASRRAAADLLATPLAMQAWDSTCFEIGRWDR